MTTSSHTERHGQGSAEAERQHLPPGAVPGGGDHHRNGEQLVDHEQQDDGRRRVRESARNRDEDHRRAEAGEAANQPGDRGRERQADQNVGVDGVADQIQHRPGTAVLLEHGRPRQTPMARATPVRQLESFRSTGYAAVVINPTDLAGACAYAGPRIVRFGTGRT